MARLKKRGEGMTMNTLVIAILSLIVLVIMIFVFKGQIGKTSSSYTTIAEESEKSAKKDSCGGFLDFDRKCADDCSKIEPKGTWTSTSEGTCPDNSQFCCEKEK